MFVANGLSIVGAVGFFSAILASGVIAQPRCSALEIPVMRHEGPPSQYVRFCESNPEECALFGDNVLHSDPSLHRLLNRVNEAVNTEIELVSDPDRLGVEEDWNFPQNCQGDCEDFALEKRHRLVEAGLSSAALTIAIVHHELQFFPHAVLLVETDTGTWVLDNLYDEIICWDVVPYRYERRELPDGQWVRFQIP